MNVTIFIGGLSGGGAERVACNLANHLVYTGNQVEILTMSDEEAGYSLSNRVSRSVLLGREERKNLLHNTILRMYRLYRYMHTHKNVDAYVVMLPITILMILLLRFATKAKIIISERNDPQNYERWLQYALRHFSGKAHGIIFQTNVVARWYEPYVNKIDRLVIPNAINPAFIRNQYTGVRKNVIVAAGRLNTQKNFPLLLRAFAKVAPEFPEYELVIYGKGNLRSELQDLASSLGIGKRVVFSGHVQNMPEELEKASMFVLSSDYEGMPNALMEAMALGLPCVSTDCGGGGARFLIEDGVNGLLVPVNDVQAMANAMRSILRSPEKATALGRNARKIQETQAPEKIYGQWEKFIQEVVEECNE